MKDSHGKRRCGGIRRARWCAAMLAAGIVGWLGATRGAMALSTDRAANLFSGDEDIVLKTTAAGTASWSLSNDYAETIKGTATVTDGKIRIPTYGLRYGKYNFAVEGDGQVSGGLMPPLMDVHPDLAPLVFAVFNYHWKSPEEGLMWQQMGAWEVRFE